MKTKVLNLVMLCVLVKGAVAVEPITLKLWPDGPPTAMAPKSDATVKLIQSYGGAGPMPTQSKRLCCTSNTRNMISRLNSIFVPGEDTDLACVRMANRSTIGLSAVPNG